MVDGDASELSLDVTEVSIEGQYFFIYWIDR